MNKIFKTILIISIAAFGLGLLALSPAKAADGLTVEWSTDGSPGSWQPLSGPIFNETNFLPADGVSRLIRATNNREETLKIGTKAKDFTICSGICLADKLNLKITDESSNTLYEKSLTEFFNEGEVPLSDVVGLGGNTTYKFLVTFTSGADDDYYQNQKVSFNLIVGAFGEEVISEEITPSGGGGFLSSGSSVTLLIFNEAASGIDFEQASVTWETNKPATSRVIYSSQFEPHALQLDNPPNYGYMHSTAEDVSLTFNHSMDIYGLEPGTTYYFRCVSHGSFAMSVERSFTTPGTRRTVAGEEEFVYEGAGPGSSAEGEGGSEELGEGEATGETAAEDGGQSGLGKLLASIAGFFSPANLCWLFFILILIIAILFLFYVAEKKIEKKKQWIGTVVILILLVLYYLFGCPNYFWLLLIILLLTILFLIFKKKLAKPVPFQ